MAGLPGWLGYLVVAAIGFALGRFSAFRARPSDDAEIPARNARTLDAIAAHLGIAREATAASGKLSPAVRTLADQGDVIEAIKRYRQETGAGLKESKEAIEDYRAGLGH